MKCLVVIRPDRVGDVILSSSCISSLRAALPETKLIWGARCVMRPLFEGHPRLDGFLGLPDQQNGWWHDVKEMTKRLHELQADAFVCMHPNSRLYAAVRRAGVARRIGYPLKGWSWALTDCLPDRRSEGGRHEADYNFDLLDPMGISRPEKLNADVFLSEGDRSSLESKLPWKLTDTGFVVVNPTAFSEALRWPADRFSTVARRFQQQNDWEIVIAGSSRDDYSVCECARWLEQERCRFVNLAGQTNLGELGWLLKNARLSISRDTGASHLAAAVDCPAVVVFARREPPYGPTRWRPLNDRTAIITPAAVKKRWETRRRFWTRGLCKIGIEEVCEAAGKVLSR